MPAKAKSARRSPAEMRAAILREATALFIERGYAGASMNELNARVGGSKVSLYKHFGSKQKLFAAVLDDVLREHMSQLEALDYDNPDLHAGLESIAMQTLATVSSPQAVGIWRLLYTEAPRSPYLGRMFISHGPARTFAGVSRFFARHAELGHLKCGDPDAAAEYFVGMLLHGPMLHRYCDVHKPYSRARLKSIAGRVSCDFLRMCEAL